MFYKVSKIEALENFILKAYFENNEIKLYDIKKLFDKYSAFKTLLEVNNLFEQVVVDVGGYGVSWNDDLDLSCNELYYNGILVDEVI